MSDVFFKKVLLLKVIEEGVLKKKKPCGYLKRKPRVWGS